MRVVLANARGLVVKSTRPRHSHSSIQSVGVAEAAVAVAPYDGIAPDHGVTPNDGVTPYNRVAPNDGVVPHRRSIAVDGDCIR